MKAAPRILTVILATSLASIPCAPAQSGGVTISSFSPASMLTRQAGVLLLNGSGFAPGDEVRLSSGCGTPQVLQTTVVSPFQVLADVPGLIFARPHGIAVWRGGLSVALAGSLLVLNRAPVIHAVTPASLVAGSSQPQALMIQGDELGVYSDPYCGIEASRFYWLGPDGTWFQPAMVLPGTTFSVQIPPQFLATPGPALVRFENPPPGGGAATFPVTVACGTLNLSMVQPDGPGSVRIRNTCGAPGSLYVTVISFAPENSTSPGTGWWGGLHVSILVLAEQVATGLPPFVGNLDMAGGSEFALPGGSLPAGLGLAFGVTHVFGPGTFNVLEMSPIASLFVP